MQLRVLKNDGTTEVYYHTKVMGTIGQSLSESGSYADGVVDSLAEAVSSYISKNYGCSIIESDQIHSIIQAVMSETGFFNAALILHEHRIIRQSQRNRMEIVHFYHDETYDNKNNAADVLMNSYFAEPWNKSTIVWHLENERGLSRGLSRMIAGQVEEKVLRLNCHQITSGLVREMIENELFHILKVEKAITQSYNKMPSEPPSFQQAEELHGHDKCVVAAGKENVIQ